MSTSSDFSYHITGFQSACSEYHEDLLSLDKRYLANRPATFIVEVQGRSLALGVLAGDKLIIDRSLTPREGQLVLVVINNDFSLQRFSQKIFSGDAENGDFVWGVITTLLREFK
jgi:SOS-response transcriptional repressor LexA